MGFRQCLFGLQWIVDNDDVGTPPGQHAADRGGDPASLGGRIELGHRLMPRREPGREAPLVPVTGDDAPAVARQFVGELLRIADAEDLRARIAAQTPRREGDRRQVRLQMARRQVDDQPADLTFKQCGQFRGDNLKMPAEQKPSLRVELDKSAAGEAREIAPQQIVITTPGHRLVH